MVGNTREVTETTIVFNTTNLTLNLTLTQTLTFMKHEQRYDEFSHMKQPVVF
jgi:hypothetical protein